MKIVGVVLLCLSCSVLSLRTRGVNDPICPTGERQCIQEEVTKVKAFTDAAKKAIGQGRDEIAQLASSFQMSVENFENQVASAQDLRKDIAEANNGHHVAVKQQIKRDKQRLSQQLRDELADLNNEIEELEGDLKILKEDLETVKQNLEQALEKEKELKQKIADLEAAIDKLEKEKEQLEQHLEDCEELQRVHRETEALEDQIKKMKAATKVINENIDVNNQEVANTLAKITHLTTGELAKITEEIGDLKKDIQAAEVERKKQHEAHGATVADITGRSSLAAMGARKALAKWVPNPQLPAAPYETTAEGMSTVAKKWFNIFRSEEGDDALRTSLMNPTKGSGSAFTRLVTTCNSDRPETCSEIDSAAYPVIYNAFSFTAEAAQQLDQDVANEVAANEALAAELKQLEDEIAEEEEQISRLLELIDAAKDKKEKLSQEVDDVINEMDNVNSALEAAGARINGLEGNIKTLATQKDELEQSTDALREKLQVLDDAMDGFCGSEEEDHEMVKEFLADSAEELQEAQQKIEEAKDQHRAASEEDAKVKGELQSGRTKLTELRNGLEFTDVDTARKALSKQKKQLDQIKSATTAINAASAVHG